MTQMHLEERCLEVLEKSTIHQLIIANLKLRFEFLILKVQNKCCITQLSTSHNSVCILYMKFHMNGYHSLKAAKKVDSKQPIQGNAAKCDTHTH